MANIRTPTDRWVQEGLRALASGGPEAVRVETIARKLGVTKGGFYWHFEDRKALLDAVLKRWEESLVDEVIAKVEAEGGTPRDRLRALFRIASERNQLLRADLAIRDWARRDRAIARRLRRVDNRRFEFMRSLFGQISTDADDVEVRCFMAFSLWIGDHYIAADHGDRTRQAVLRAALLRLEA